MPRKILTRIVLVSTIFFHYQCSLNDLGLGRDSGNDEELGLALIAGSYFLNLADVRVSGVSVFFENPQARTGAKLGNQVRFRSGRTQDPNRVDSLLATYEEESRDHSFYDNPVSRQTVSLSSAPNSRGEFEAFLKFGVYTGTVFDSERRSRGTFSFRLSRDRDGILRITDRFIEDSIFIRMSAFRIVSSGSGSGDGSQDPDDGGIFGDEPDPELFN